MKKTKTAALKKAAPAKQSKQMLKPSAKAAPKKAAAKSPVAKMAAPKSAAKMASAPKAQAPVESEHHDIIKIILDDHKPLKRLIAIMKDSEATASARRAAFNEFAPLLTIHAKSEERVLYTYQREDIDMREESFEGDVEHGLADQMVMEVKQTADKDLWSAKLKVLAELVEHHIKEEEEEIFPEFKKCSEVEDRIQLGEEYLAEKERVKGDVLHPAVHREERVQQARH